MGFTLAGGRRLAASLGQIDCKVAKCCCAVEESVVEVEPTPVPPPGSQGPLPAPGWPGLERPGSVLAPGMHEPLGLRPRRDGWDWSGRFAALAPRLRRGRWTVIRAGMAGNAPAAATPAPGGGGCECRTRMSSRGFATLHCSTGETSATTRSDGPYHILAGSDSYWVSGRRGPIGRPRFDPRMYIEMGRPNRRWGRLEDWDHGSLATGLMGPSDVIWWASG